MFQDGLKVWHIAAVVILVFIIGCAGCSTGGFHYSDGFREGHVQKFSHKGIAWKTWEGEMAMPGMKMVGSDDNAHLSNVFEFTVLDPEIQKQIQALHAKDYVRLHYEQYLCSPPWYGSTQYRIVKVEKVAE